MNTAPADKFNYLVLIFAAALIISLFTRFSDTLGVQSAIFMLLSLSLFFNVNYYSPKFKYYVIPLLLFVLAAVFSYYGADFQYNARKGIILLSYCSAAYMLMSFMKTYDKRSILLIPVFISLWLTIYLIATNFTISGIADPSVLSKSTKATAAFLLLTLPVSFVFWWTEKKIYLYTSCIILAALAITRHYFAISLACLVFAAFMYLMRDKVKIKTYFTTLPLLAAAAASFNYAVKAGYFSQKPQLWQNAAAVIKDNFIFGAGFGNYSTVSGFYSSVKGLNVSSADNFILQVAAETGIAGFVFFAAVLAVFFFLIIKKLRAGENKALYLPILLAVSVFMVFNFFESSMFVSTNMLLFFILLAFPADAANVKIRLKRINAYIVILAVLPLCYAMALPLLAFEDYKKGLMFFAANKFDIAEDYYLRAINKDAMNPVFSDKLSDTYFAVSQKMHNKVDLDKAIEYVKYAISLDKYNGNYYYDLAYLYHNKGEKQLASDNITKALEMDKFNVIYNEAYGELVY